MKFSLKVRLTIIISLIVFLTLLGQGLLLIHNWKQAIRSEVNSSYSLAKRLVGSHLITPTTTLNDLQKKEIVGLLEGMRHIRVMVQYGNETYVETDQSTVGDINVPLWFSRLIYPYEDALPKVDIYGLGSESKLSIQADTHDEIQEVWEDFKIQSIITISFAVFIIFLMYIGLHFGLRPLKELESGFQKLEQGDFNAKISENVSKELSVINQKFNHLVSVLKNTSDDNALLVKKLIDIQEEERRTISSELHDEMGPHLFSIRVNVSEAKSFLNDEKYKEVKNQLSVIDDSVNNLQSNMRRLLKELRPLILDDLSIEEAIYSIVESGVIGALNIDWNLDLSALDAELNDTLRVTLYRIVQECVTNIVRHSEAKQATIMIACLPDNTDEKYLKILIEDDGKGIDNDISYGFGLIGMRERVQALGGKFQISRSTKGGVSLLATIPMS